ncbi:VOC family protein [Roseiterribacter gracilis]|uniref:VOC domain-containing protein n=1 Tax=Roseiterribacter gracilis TaxID=2812848 RepID=A0A8S8XA95_9PROT|nr:hypothetical protein TMPK1_03030 [Rhodospirillales bacterium TMPK1]
MTLTSVRQQAASDTRSGTARPTLGAIRGATLVVPDLAAIERAYVGLLELRVAARGTIDDATASMWGAPKAAGRRFLDLEPASGERVYLRFVENPAAQAVPSLTTHGWNAIELTVQDVHALAARLAGSDFRIIGEPRGLTRFPMIVAMQVIGPAGECLYLTEIGQGSGLDLASARSLVGRIFIMVAGGPDIETLFATYAGFANDIDPPVSTPVRVLSRANELPDDTLHAHGLIKLPQGTLIELDEYPAVTMPRACAVGDLPAGIVSVRFGVTTLPARDYVGTMGVPGRRIACLVGAAGERIELEEGIDR